MESTPVFDTYETVYESLALSAASNWVRENQVRDLPANRQPYATVEQSDDFGGFSKATRLHTFTTDGIRVNRSDG